MGSNALYITLSTDNIVGFYILINKLGLWNVLFETFCYTLKNNTKNYRQRYSNDQRYATPKRLHENLSQDESFEYVGRFSVFEDRVEVIDKNETVFIFPSKTLTLK